MTFTSYPRIRVAGAPYDRGREYGDEARPQIEASRDGYERSFRHDGILWRDARASASGYLAAIESAFPSAIAEMHGIADGSGIEFTDVLVMNCRTEIVWAHMNRQAGSTRMPAECSTFGLTPDRTEAGRTWIGQNWDWLVHAFDTVVLLEIERADGPDFVTIVEAGLLAKASMNAAGVGVAVNTLITSDDIDTDGVPFHVLLHALTDAETAFDAVELLASHRRASSGHYLVGTAGGAILGIECEPGGVGGVHPISPAEGLVTHTNHFLSDIDAIDLAPSVMADSYVRKQRLHDLLDREPVASIQSVGTALADHVDAPGSICCHPDERADESHRWASISSVIMDLEERVFHLSDGNPCSMPRRRIEFGSLRQSSGHAPEVAR